MLQSLFKARPATPARRLQSRVKQMTTTDLYQQLRQGNAPLLVDVRSLEEYHMDGHIAGSRLLPLPALSQRLNELPKDKPIVCVCRSGNRSQVACEQLASQGFSDVTNLRGGMMDWRRQGLPSQ